MCRICIADVCVRSKVSGCGVRAARAPASRVPWPPSRIGESGGEGGSGSARYSVSCMSRAGWSARHVERFEVVVVVLDLGAFEHLVAEAREDLLHLLAHEAERMAVAEQRRAAGQRDVDGAGRTARRRQRGFTLGDRRFDRFFQLVGKPAERALLLGRGLADRLHERGDPAAFAPDPSRAQRLQFGVRTHAGQLLLEDGQRAIGTDAWDRSEPPSGPQSRVRRSTVPWTVDRRPSTAQAAESRPWPCATTAANASGSRAASSARLLRSSVMPAALRPFIKTL